MWYMFTIPIASISSTRDGVGILYVFVVIVKSIVWSCMYLVRFARLSMCGGGGSQTASMNSPFSAAKVGKLHAQKEKKKRERINFMRSAHIRSCQ